MQHRNYPPKKQPIPSKKRNDSAEKKTTETVETVLNTQEAIFLNEQEQGKVINDCDRKDEAGRKEFYD